MLPPLWVRRLLLAPLMPVATVVLLTSLPVVALIAVFASPVLPGRLRPLRLLLFAIVFLVAESLALLAMLGLWVAAGFGRHLGEAPWQDRHYRVMRAYLRLLVHTAERTFKLAFDLDLDEARRDDGRLHPGDAPVIVLSRHAGPGDSFLLAHGLLALGLRPRIVLRHSLQWAPALDVGLNRLPCHFVGPADPPGSGAVAVGALAAGMGPGDALLIFPEGRNFTANRRLHSIARLEELGRHREADQAREMRYVLTPRPGGALAAIEACPRAEVAFVAHTGLEDLSSVVDLWRGLPMDARVAVKAWRVPAREVPRHPQEATSWLLDWWRRIDTWILSRSDPAHVPDAVVTVVEEAMRPDDPPPSSSGG